MDDCLIACNSKNIMAAFKKGILTRFVGTDEGEVTKYLGCELIRDRSAKTAKIVQKGYAERVLKTFGMLDSKPCATPLDANSRLSQADYPQVVDPLTHTHTHTHMIPTLYTSLSKYMYSISTYLYLLESFHHRYHSTGCLSYLVIMTRTDLAFAYSQLSKFVQYPVVVHLHAAERVLQYVCGTYDQGITYCDPASWSCSQEQTNRLGGQ